MFKPVIVFSLFLAAGIATAADPVTDAMQKAYVPYRVALFKTNGTAQDDSRQAVAQAQQGWNQIVSQFGARPPVPYDRDPEFSSALAEVSQVYAKAAQEVENNQLARAHETLERAREVMAELRQRNQVIIYSDHMNAYHKQMEHVLIAGEEILAAPNGMLQLTAQVGALEYLAGKLKSEAPADYLKNEGFSALYQAVDGSVANLKAALLSQDSSKVKEAIGRIKGPYSKLFIKFG
jgi:hypothetical protein